MGATGTPASQSKPRRRLFWRIYWNGILLLVLVAAAVTSVALATGDPHPWREAPHRLAQLLSEELDSPTDITARLQRRLQESAELLDVDLAVFGPDGSRLAEANVTGQPAVPPPPPDVLTQLLSAQPDSIRHLDRRFVALPLGPPGHRQGVLVVTTPWSHDPARLLAFVAAILAALALASLPLARAIVRPLDQLIGTARRLAAGELSARTELDRKDEVGLLAGTMDHMADRLQQRIRSERELLANVSHELRTPLSRLRVALALGEEETGSPEAIRIRLAGMIADLDELDTLVDNVLLSTRLELAADPGAEPGLAIRPGPVDWSDLASGVKERFARFHPNRSLRVILAADPPEVQADAGLLRRVLNNLLDNAAKYGPPDQAVELEAIELDGRLQVEVRDRGIGVDPADLARLFDPFYRTETARSRSAGGVGLGLTLCRRVIEAHRGRIEATARPGGGLVMRFWIPLVQVDSSPPSAQAP